MEAISGRPISVRLIDHFLYARLTRTVGPDLGPFVSTPLDELIPLLRWLGFAGTLPWSGRWPRTNEMHGVDPVEIGARIAADWPRAFSRLLDEGSHRPRSSTEINGMIGRYGWVYEQFVSRLGEGEAQTAVRSVLRDHAIAAEVVASGEAVLGFPAGHGSVGIVEARRMMGMGFDRARRLLHSDGRVPNASRRGVRHDISRRDVLLLAGRRRGIGVQALGLRLGVGRKMIRGLLDSGLLDEARVVSEGKAISFDATKIDLLIANIYRAPLATCNEASGALVDPVAATRISGLSMRQLLECVEAHSIHPVRWPNDGALADARFRHGDLVGLRSERAGSTLSAVARRLGLHPEAARALAMDGILMGERLGANWRFAEAAVEAFRRDHVTGTELARRYEISPKATVALLSASGVHPVAGPPRCRQVVYRRDMVARSGVSIQIRGDGERSGARRSTP